MLNFENTFILHRSLITINFNVYPVLQLAVRVFSAVNLDSMITARTVPWV